MKRSFSTFLAGAAAMSLLSAGARANPTAPVSVASLPPPDSMAVVTGQDQAYKIGPFDVLDISVFQVDLLSKEVQVDASGHIQYPMIGDVDVVGKTAKETADEIASKLDQGYLRSPQVTVVVKDSASQKFTVEGAVHTSGIYPLQGHMTLLRAIAIAQGVNEDAKPKDVVIFRTVHNQRMAGVVNLAEVGKGQVDDPTIYPGDLIVVPTSGSRRFFKDLISATPLLLFLHPLRADRIMTPNDLPSDPETPDHRGAAVATLDLSRSTPAKVRPTAISTTLVETPQESGGAAMSTNLLHIWNVLVKWRWPIAAVTLLGLAAGVGVTLTTTPIYQATTTIQIDTEPAKVQATPNQNGYAAYQDPEKYYLTQYELLKSRALAEQVVKNDDLADDAAFLHPPETRAFWRKPPPPPAPSSYDARSKTATGMVMGGLTIAPVRASRLVKISFESPDPSTAARVANAVASTYIAWNLQRRYQASSDARKFLEDRLSQTKAELEASQKRGNDFAQANHLITVAGGAAAGPGQAAATTTGESIDAADLSAIDTNLATATTARIQAQQHWQAAQNAPDSAVPEIISDTSYMALRAARDAAQADYQQNLRLYRPGFPSMVDAKAKIDALDKQLAAISASIRNSLKTQYQVAERNEGQLQGEVAKRKSGLLAAQTKRVDQGVINTDITTSQTLYDSLLASYKQIGIEDAIQDNNISVVDKALRPGGPIKPQPGRNLAVFGALGLAMGILLAFMLEQFDLTIKVPEDVEKVLGLPVLATIPVLGSGASAVKALEDPKSQLSEGYYSARAALQLSTPEGVPSTLLVTSSMMGEGKSTSALALASGFGRLGKRVLLVDADMRNPVQHRLVGRDNSVGLSTLLSGGQDIRPALQPTGYLNLSFLAAGRPPPNPSELLASGKMESFLQVAREHFDIVVIDSPPVMGLADAPQLANMVHGVLMVVQAGGVKRDIARAAIRRLRASNSPLVGALFTKFDIRKAGFAYGHAYSYGYGRGYGFEYGESQAKPKELPILARLTQSMPGRKAG
jgi:capsular exopolysaccharide synthesis family protein